MRLAVLAVHRRVTSGRVNDVQNEQWRMQMTGQVRRKRESRAGAGGKIHRNQNGLSHGHVSVAAS